MVILQMRYRDYKIDTEKLYQWNRIIILENKLPKDNSEGLKGWINSKDIFSTWHNNRYLVQCMFNLEEKYDCQGVTDDELNILLKGYKEITGKDWTCDILR